MRALGASIRAGMLAASACALAACGQREASGELQWARAALERNPSLEVVSVDEDRKVFTVRTKPEGTLRTLALGELAAAPVDALTQPPVASGAVSPEPGAAPAAPSQGAAPAEAADSGRASAAQPGEAAGMESDGATAASASETPGYTVERSGGRVQITGPGVSIATAAPAGAPAPARPQSRAAARESGGADDPLVCEGERFLRIDDRTLDVVGDAVIARDGCELHITNSRIRASGTAVFASGAKVHLRNSIVEGAGASIEASAGAEVYVQGSTLSGLARRLGGATVHDLGGNTWR